MKNEQGPIYSRKIKAGARAKTIDARRARIYATPYGQPQNKLYKEAKQAQQSLLLNMTTYNSIAYLNKANEYFKSEEYKKDEFADPIITQKYCDFLQSEILFRGNSLLYLLYLEIYPYLVVTPQEENVQSKNTMDVVGGQAYGTMEKNRGGSLLNTSKLPMKQTKGGRENLDKLKTPDCKVLLIYAVKLLSELHHDFKGQGKTLSQLNDIVKLYEINIEKFQNNCAIGADAESAFFNNLRSGHGEWHFFKCALDYLIDKGLFDELTIIKYRSVTDSLGHKDYFLLDMDGKEAVPLFDPDVFNIRYPDNSTCDSALSKLLYLDQPKLDWKPKTIIQNAPSLTDPATIGFIDVAKFYPVLGNTPLDEQIFNFQKCQDLNNYFDPFNKIIVEIMCEGINTFFNLFGGKYENDFDDYWNGTTPPSDLTTYTTLYNAAPIKFIIMGGDRTTNISPNTDTNNFAKYVEHLYSKNENKPLQGQVETFYYSGIIIKSNTGIEYELRVGDTTIKNITALVNDANYVTQFVAQTQNTTTPLQTNNTSWFRLCSLANYIKTTIPPDRFQTNDQALVLKFLIVCLKALGDWFQVFYVSSIHYRCLPPNSDDDEFARQFNGLVKYLSSSDKNTIADMMIHSISTNSTQSLRFLGNGFSVKPSENLYKRFPAFFDNAATPSAGYGEDFGVSIEQTSNEDQMPPKGKDNDENEDIEEGAGVGSLKGIFLNFQVKGEDIKGKIQKLLQEQKSDIDKELFVNIINEQDAQFTGNKGFLLKLYKANENDVNEKINALNESELKIIKNCLTRIPLIYQMYQTNLSTIETDLKMAIDLQEAQMKAIGKIVESKHGPTQAEIVKLQSMFQNPVINDLKTKITNKITKLLGPSTVLATKVGDFSAKIQNAVNDSRTRLSSFFGKIKSKSAQTPTGRSSGRSKIYGAKELIEEFDPVYNPLRDQRGGRRRARRTIKRRHKRTMKNRRCGV